MMRSVGGFMMAVLLATAVAAQAPAPKPASAAATRPAGTPAQVMRGIYFPNSNVIFDVQQTDPAAPKKAPTEIGRSASETYANTYSGSEGGENAAVAPTDGVDLILRP